MRKSIERDFQKAKEDLEFRAEYVKSVNMERMREYVKRVDYNSEQCFAYGGVPDMMTCFKPEDGYCLSRLKFILRLLIIANVGTNLRVF